MMTVRDVMTQPVISVRPGTPLKEVAHLLVDCKISGLPVVDEDGVVLGIVSEADFLVKEQGIEAVRRRRLARIIGESRESRSQLAKIGALTAGEAMTAPAVTISADSRIAQAAAAMTSHGVKRLPVLEDGRLVGIVTRADLVRAFVRSDEELARTIREDVLLRTLWLDPILFNVTVKDGSASIIGHVERRSTAELIQQVVGMVPGIMTVQAEVSWSLDDSRVETPTIDSYFPFSPR